MKKQNLLKNHSSGIVIFLAIFSSFILFVLSFYYFLFINNNQANITPFYKNEGSGSRGNFTTVVRKQAWSGSNQKNKNEFFAKNITSENFKAQTNDLGIISIPFDTHKKSVKDEIVFRLKEAGSQNWYFQGNYNASQFQTDIPFPFGFPVIRNSRNVSYTFEIESLAGKPGDSISLSKTENYFFAKYIFSKAELIKTPFRLVEFLVAKTTVQMQFLGIREISTIFLVGLLPFMIYFNLKRSGKRKIETTEGDSRNVYVGFFRMFSVIASVVIFAGAFSMSLTGYRKWISYLSLFIPSVLLSINFFRANLFKNKYFSVIAGALFFIILILGIYNFKHLFVNSFWLLSWFGVSGLLIVYCYLLILPLKNYKYLYFISAGTFIFLFNINSVFFLNSYAGKDYIWTAVIIVLVLWAFFSSLFGQSSQLRWDRVNKVVFIVLLIISVVLALRSDSLFLGSSEYHWSYFVGVIQTIRNGGELLWSAPSQYGFLNILLPSILPWTSRNSFFIFQAALFFICTVIIIETVYACFKNKATFIVISLAGLSLFYFADPALIGPTLYPSSSAVRFFSVYVLVYVILRELRKRTILNGGIKWVVTSIYALGALWSAESFIYCTAIYATYLLASAISMSKLKNGPFKFLLRNILVVFTSFIVFNIFYLVITRHFPDWTMYFMYVFGYASGVGELEVPRWEIYWAVIIGLSGIVFILSRLYSAKKYSEWIVVSVCFTSLWILTSYYIGRAVVNNLTALLPLIFYIFIVILLVLKDSTFIRFRLLLYAVFMPWVVVGVIGGIGNPQFINTLKGLKFAENIDSKSYEPADRELSGILRSLKVTEKTRMAYWDLYESPVVYDKSGKYMDPIAGIPMPLVLLEKPLVSKGMRDVIVERFFDNLNESVFLIHRKKNDIARFSVWTSFFKQNYILEKKEIVSMRYEVFLIRHK